MATIRVNDYAKEDISFEGLDKDINNLSKFGLYSHMAVREYNQYAKKYQIKVIAIDHRRWASYTFITLMEDGSIYLQPVDKWSNFYINEQKDPYQIKKASNIKLGNRLFLATYATYFTNGKEVLLVPDQSQILNTEPGRIHILPDGEVTSTQEIDVFKKDTKSRIKNRKEYRKELSELHTKQLLGVEEDMLTPRERALACFEDHGALNRIPGWYGKDHIICSEDYEDILESYHAVHTFTLPKYTIGDIL